MLDMRVKIFMAQNYDYEIKKMEQEINDFLASTNFGITDTYFTVDNGKLYYFVEYEED